MAITLNDSAQVNAPRSMDNKYLLDGANTYANITQVNNKILSAYRTLGLTVLIGNDEYWYRNGITNSDLVLKTNNFVQQQVDWNQGTSSAFDFIKNKPSFSTVAYSGSFADLLNIPANVNLIAGSGITITGSYPNLQINSTVVGSGTVTSVALTVPSGLSVSGSPITNAGTLAITTTLNGPLRGTGTGFTTGNLNLASEVTGILAKTNGGTGTATPSLVAGSNVTIAGSWPNQTINATAGTQNLNTTLGIGNTTTNSILITNNSTNNLQFQAGTFGIQSYSSNNGWLADNLYYNGTNWAYVNNGYGILNYFNAGTWGVYTAPSGAGGTTAPIQAMLSVSNLGLVQIPSISTVSSPPTTSGTTKMVITDGTGQLSFANIPSGGGSNYWTLTGSDISNNNAGNVGIGISSPAQLLHVYKDIDGLALMQFQNPNTGTSAASGIKLSSSGGDSYFYRTSAAYIGGLGDSTTIQDAGGGDIILYTAAEGFRLTNAGNIKIPLLATGLTAPTTSGTTKMVITDANGQLSFANIPSGASPAGSNTQIQFNNSGAFGADSNFTWDNTSKSLQITGTTVTSLTSKFKIFGNTATGNIPSIGGIRFAAITGTFIDNTTAANGTSAQVSTDVFSSTTYSASNTNITYTDATTLYVTAPSAGTNVTFTNNNAILTYGGIKITSGTGGFTGDQIRSSGNTGAGTTSTGAGTGGSSSSSVCGDLVGTINIVTGTSPATSATVFTYSYTSAFGAKPKVILQPANAAAAALTGSGKVYIDDASSSNTQMIMKSGSSALAASTTYIWYYHVIQ
jgi:hypothetical protein